MHPLEHSSLILKPGCSYLCGLNFKPFQLQNYFKHRKFHKHRKIDTFIMLSLIFKIYWNFCKLAFWILDRHCLRQGQEHIAVTFKIYVGKGEVFVHLLVRRGFCRLCLVMFNFVVYCWYCWRTVAEHEATVGHNLCHHGVIRCCRGNLGFFVAPPARIYLLSMVMA